MEFYVPLADTPEDSETLYQELAALYKGTPAQFDERVRLIRWNHNGEEYVAEVGKGIKATKPLSARDAARVLAIYQGDPWVIVREPGRSKWNDSVLAGPRTVNEAQFFDQPASDL